VHTEKEREAAENLLVLAGKAMKKLNPSVENTPLKALLEHACDDMEGWLYE
jgi:hypothetical protein